MSVYNNQITLIGNLGKPAEIVETKAGTVAKFSLAVYRNGKGNDAITDWIGAVAWHDLARGMAEIDKGTKLIITGSIQTRSYEAKDGTRKYITEVAAREIGVDISIKKDVDDVDNDGW
jgi:single-strand DNA-binding protein